LAEKHSRFGFYEKIVENKIFIRENYLDRGIKKFYI